MKISPQGKAKWAYLRQPDEGFVGESGVPKYKLNLVLDPVDPLVETFVKDLEALMNETAEEKPCKTIPVEDEVDKDGNKTGQIVTGLKFKSGYDFSDGMAAVQVGERWGFVDSTGKMAIPATYKSPGTFS